MSAAYVKKTSDHFYPSNVVGSHILDAITGAKFPWKVGEIGENQFFKVNIPPVNNQMGSHDQHQGQRVSHKLYYETPYHYMAHRNVELDEELIKNWYAKMNKLYPDTIFKTSV